MTVIQIDKEKELQVRGCVLAGDYNRAAELAAAHGPEAVLVAMNAAFLDGFFEAMEHTAHHAMGELKRSRGK